MALGKRRLLMLRWGGLCAVSVFALGALAIRGSLQMDPAARDEDGTVQGLTSVLRRGVSEEMVSFHFEDVTATSGLNFKHFPAPRKSLLPEDMGSGLAWGDHDGDGDEDLFLVNFRGNIHGGPSGLTQGACALYRNDGAGKFTDVSETSGLGRTLFGMGAAWGDYDGDGDLDLYVTAYGPNLLFRNEGDGTFTDVTEQAGVGDTGFGAGATWGDYDRDGHIDLYVTNYVLFEHAEDEEATSDQQLGSEIPFTINPSSYPAAPNRLYRNQGEGHFVDVAEAAGVANQEGRSLGAVWMDFDSDGWPDLYVANDVSANGVFHNLGDGTFKDIGASSLAADYRGAMGLAVGDPDHDGDQDLLVTHWLAQESAFFENMYSRGLRDATGKRRLLFMDVAEAEGLGQVSLPTVGWATGFADFDNDGELDLWIVNGNTLEMPSDTTRLKPQPVHLFRRIEGRGFFEMGAQACPRLAEPVVGRGGAHVDFDGDGRLDLAILVHGGAPILLRNTTVNQHHWLGVRLQQDGANSSALGAALSIRTGEVTRSRQVGTEVSYLSQGSAVAHFGLGDADLVNELRIIWPDGAEQVLTDVPVDQLLTVSR